MIHQIRGPSVTPWHYITDLTSPLDLVARCPHFRIPESQLPFDTIVETILIKSKPTHTHDQYGHNDKERIHLLVFPIDIS